MSQRNNTGVTKLLVEVESQKDIPDKIKDKCLIVSEYTWESVRPFLDHRKKDFSDAMYIFIPDEVSINKLLKFFEDVPINIVVYTNVEFSSVLISRFSNVVSKVSIGEDIASQTEVFKSKLEEEWDKCKKALSLR